MTTMVQIPVWLLVVILGFATIAALDKVMLPSVRWFFRRRMERVVAKLNTKLARPIEPFKLARRHDMIQRLIYDPEVSRAINEHAEAEGIPENVAFEEARRYAREIVPSFSASAYFGFAIRLAKFISRALYRVRLGHLAQTEITEAGKTSTLVFVMNHRSNVDYLLVTYLASGHTALSYAVGEWARIWPLSRLIKSLGAYFIRRKSRGLLYRRVLARYVRLATDAGVMQAMFPEGGLSLDGALAPAKLGLLKYIADGHDLEGRDVAFIPVAINYDRVLEDRILLEAHANGTRRFKAKLTVVVGFAFRQLWYRMRGRYRHFGYAAVSFGAPVSLQGYLKKHGGEDLQGLADQLMDGIGSIVPVLPVPLVASVLSRAKAPMLRANIDAAVKKLIKQMPNAHVYMPREGFGSAVEQGLMQLTRRRLIEETSDGFSVIGEQAHVVGYYAASIAHLRR